MAIESRSALTSIADHNLENRSISELVSILRESFQTKDFDHVEDVLVSKELKMRKEIENKSKEYENLQGEFDFLKLDNLALGSSLQRNGFEKWKESENEIRTLKELICQVNADREKKMSAMEGLQKSQEAAEKAREDDRVVIEKLRNKNLELECAMEDREKTIEELKCKNSKLECGKREAELNYDLCKRKYDELRLRISQLENRNLVGKKGAANDKSENRSDPDGDIQNRYDSSRLKLKDPGKRYNERWEAEAEMRAAFDENDLLCMEAVCILYKQSSPIGKPSSALPSRQRGFNEADMLRGSTLALFLTSGDSKGTLKKSVMELNNFDIGGLIDCRRIAIKYLKQLFEIYKNNEDQFLFQ